jgi:hypothetical protein
MAGQTKIARKPLFIEIQKTYLGDDPDSPSRAHLPVCIASLLPNRIDAE